MTGEIYSLDENGWRCGNSLWYALGFHTFPDMQNRKQDTGVVSVVGAGGKTTVIRRLREECLGGKIPHIVSTTTHMQTGPEECFVTEADLERIKNILKEKGTVWMGIPISKEKMGSFSLDFLEDVENLGVWMFLEADGAKRLPVKAPRDTEPVILNGTTHVVSVYGLDGIGQQIGKCCCRPEYVAQILNKNTDEILEWKDLVKLALSPWGGRKSVTGEMEYHVILNKADTKEQKRLAKRIAEAIMEQSRLIEQESRSCDMQTHAIVTAVHITGRRGQL